MEMQSVGNFSLHNEGGFLVRISFKYMDRNGQMTHSDTGDAIVIDQTSTIDPGTLGIPDGSVLWLFTGVQPGNDNTASQGFIYQSGNSCTAQYTVTGNTVDDTLNLIQVKC
jgi:hypothetical protein